MSIINARVNGANVPLANTSTNISSAGAAQIQKWLRGDIPLTIDNRLAYRQSSPQLKVKIDGKDWVPATYSWFPTHVNIWRNTYTTYEWNYNYHWSHYNGFRSDLCASVAGTGTTSYDTTTVRNISDTGLNVSMYMNIRGWWNADINTTVNQNGKVLWGGGGDWHTYGAQQHAYETFSNLSLKLNNCDVAASWGSGLGLNFSIHWSSSAEQ